MPPKPDDIKAYEEMGGKDTRRYDPKEVRK